MDLKTAEHAYVKCKDYYGVEFVKKLQTQAVCKIKKNIFHFKYEFFILFFSSFSRIKI